MPLISQTEALKKAEKAAKKWYKSNQVRIDNGSYNSVYNTGPDKEEKLDVWVSSDLQETIRRAWLNKGDFNGLKRRASFSSGETKFDLKLAIGERTSSSFNYHMPFKADDSVEIERTQQSRSDKKIAKQFQENLEKDTEDKEAERRRKQARVNQLKPTLKQLAPEANGAWNKFLKTNKKNVPDEIEWKKAEIRKRFLPIPIATITGGESVTEEEDLQIKEEMIKALFPPPSTGGTTNKKKNKK